MEPQQSLYLPWPLLQDENKIIVFDEEGCSGIPEVEITDKLFSTLSERLRKPKRRYKPSVFFFLSGKSFPELFFPAKTALTIGGKNMYNRSSHYRIVKEMNACETL